MPAPYTDQIATAVTGLIDRTIPTTAGPVIASGPVGYATGAGIGGTVTQATSKATGVLLNALCGTVTTHNASLAATTSVAFVLTNNFVNANDIVIAQHESGGTVGAYNVCTAAAAGTVSVTIRNMTAGPLVEALVLRFIVIKGSVN